MPKVVIIDPGHGMSNRRAGVYDSGTASAGVEEATVAMDYANELRGILMSQGIKVVRTRTDAKDPAPIGQRSIIAKRFHGDIMISIHCNDSGTGKAMGTETFYRGAANAAMAKRLNNAVCISLGTKSRGIKLESQSQHTSLAVMSFQPCFLIELGFMDNTQDRAAFLDKAKRLACCKAIADAITTP